MKNSRQSHIKKNLWLRAHIIQAVRTFFIEKNYLEVETPCRIPAPAPETHIDAQTSGGLLFSIPGKFEKSILTELLKAGINESHTIGKFTKKGNGKISFSTIFDC